SAAGMVAGPIYSVSFKVTAPAMGTTYGVFPNFTVAVKQTDATYVTNVFKPGAEVVWSGDYTPVTGVNTFTFSTPVEWDGVSSLIVQTCFSNNTGNINQSANVEMDMTSYPAHTVYTVHGLNPDICDVAAG